jgi:hypothetical protein
MDSWSVTLSSFMAALSRRPACPRWPSTYGWTVFKCPPTPGLFSTAHGWPILTARRGPDFDLYDWGELEAHRSFVARYDFRNESRWNGDGERYVSVIAHTYVENCSSAER